MKPISYTHHRFPPDVIRHAVWLYLRFTLSYRDVEDLLAERGLTVSNVSIRLWAYKFGPLIAKNLRETRPKPLSRWRLDEMMVSIAGRLMWHCHGGSGLRSPWRFRRHPRGFDLRRSRRSDEPEPCQQKGRSVSVLCVLGPPADHIGARCRGSCLQGPKGGAANRSENNSDRQ
jgi:hypothetical protein